MFCFNDTATTEIYTLSLHDALPIFDGGTNVFGSHVAAEWMPTNLDAHIETLKEVYHRRRDLMLAALDRKSTRLNSSHANISYAVFCLKKQQILSLPSSLRTPSYLMF